MKRALSVLLSLLLLAACVPAFAETVYTPGTYTATAAGMGGDVTVTITVDESAIIDVQIQGDAETPGIGSMAIEQLPQAILEAQSAEVDAIATATVTSNAVKTALSTAMAEAKGEAIATEADHLYQADVIVLGGGGAGLSAALSAVQNGASVILLEAAGVTGGDTTRSAAHITVISDNLLNNNPRNDEDLAKYLDMNDEDFPEAYRPLLNTLKDQINEYLATTDERKFDTYERIMIDHYLAGTGKDLDGEEVYMDFDLISTALSQANDTWYWLVDNTELPDTDTYFDTRRVRPLGQGNGFVTAIQNAAVEGGAVIYTNTRATELLTDESGKVTGVVAVNADGEEETYTANKGVVIATGGFQSNGEMAAKYQNLFTGVSEKTNSTGPESEQGDGIVMAEALGAKLVDMQFVTTIAWLYGGHGISDENRELAKGMQLLVNGAAQRFTDDSRYNNTKDAGAQEDGIYYMVGDKYMYDTVGADRIADFESRGILFVGDTLAEAAEKAGLDAEALQATVDTFNGYVDAGEDPDFGRTEFKEKVLEGPFVIVKMETAYHLSLGGLLTDTQARVLKEDGSVIEGLYAAGDVTGGIEGVVHQSADNMSAVVYYGRVAGRNAANAES